MSQKTYIPSEQDEKKWVIFDARDKVLGRLATRVAAVLRGKHKADFTPHLDCGDAVVIINAADVRLTGNKLEDDGLTHHSGFIGGLKSKNYAELMADEPEEVVYQAVKGMIPKTRLGKKILKNLRIYRSDEHPHQAQQPVGYDWENETVSEE